LPIEGKIFVDVPISKASATAPIIGKMVELGFEVESSLMTELEEAIEWVEKGEIAILLQLPFDGESDLAVQLRRKAFDARVAVVTTLRGMELSLLGIEGKMENGELGVRRL